MAVQQNILQRLQQGLQSLFGRKPKKTVNATEYIPPSKQDRDPSRPGVQRPVIESKDRVQTAQRAQIKKAFGTAPSEPGTEITPPDVAGVAQQALPEISQAGAEEVKGAKQALAGTKEGVAGREQRMEKDIGYGVETARQMAQRGEDIAAEGKANVANLPAQVKADVAGIANDYKQQTDVDIGKIESLGREAVGMAMQGKNAAAEAAVQAQQASSRNAIAQINADPNIPQSRKTAMIAQITTQSSMQIAATVGANIKDFTAMQVGAMTQTMQAVGSAMTARNQSFAALGGAEINAVASAHETAAQITKGYDDLQMAARQSSEQLKFQYNNLRQTSRAMNDDVAMQLLDKDFYVGGMPYDFRMMDYNLLNDAISRDFGLQLQARGLRGIEEATQQGDEFAQQQMLLSFMPKGPTRAIVAGALGIGDVLGV